MFAPVVAGGGERDGIPQGAASEREDYDYPDLRTIPPDADWMANVGNARQMTYVCSTSFPVNTSAHPPPSTKLPTRNWDILARWGFTALWLIGLWDVQPASR